MIQNEFLTEKPTILFDKFLNDYGNIFDIDHNEAKRMLRDDSLFQKLTSDWYEKLDQNNLNDAFKVYDDDYYFEVTRRLSVQQDLFITPARSRRATCPCCPTPSDTKREKRSASPQSA